MKTIILITALSALGITASAAPAATLDLNPIADNTLYEAAPDTVATSNGAGVHMFAGRTLQGDLRRAVLRFDLSAIPAQSTIDGVSLRLYMSRSRVGDTEVSIHRLTTPWGEGASDASSNEGRGAAAEPEDATWQSAFHPDVPWSTPGGDFSAVPSAIQIVGGLGSYTWSGEGLAADVQLWIDEPAGNSGWIVIGDESGGTSAKRFATRENTQEGWRPVLTVDYTETVPVEGAAWGSIKALFR